MILARNFKFLPFWESTPSCKESKPKGKEYSFEEAKAQTLTDAKEEWTVKRIFAVFSMEIQLSDEGEPAWTLNYEMYRKTLSIGEDSLFCSRLICVPSIFL